MFSAYLSRQSLKTRITLAMLAIVLSSLWSLSFYASQMLRTDIERLINEQQLSAVPVVAAPVNTELNSRLYTLENVPGLPSGTLREVSAATQSRSQYMSAVLPAEEVFATIRNMQQHLLLATLFLTLLAGGLTWWVIRGQFSPLLATVKIVAETPDTSSPLPHFSSARRDETGQLIGAFNRLLEALGKRESALQASEARFNILLQDIPGVVYQFQVMPKGEWVFLYVSPWVMSLYEVSPEEACADHDAMIQCIIPEDRASYRESIGHSLRTLTPWLHEHRIRTMSGSLKWVRGQAVPEVKADGSVLWNGILVEITLQRQAEEALRQRVHFQNELFDNIPFMLWLKDEQSHFLAVNKAFAAGIGWPSAQSLIGKNDLDIAPPEMAALYRADDLSVLASGTSKQVEELKRTDGQQQWFETYKSPLVIDGRIVGTVGFSCDITLRKRNEAALIAAMTESEKANHSKSRFLAAASHDLRQPLSALSLYVGVLKSRSTPENAKLVGSILDCVDSLSALLTDLLDVSKLDAGVVIPKLTDFPLDELLTSLVTVHSAEAGLKGLRLRTRSTGAFVRTDQILLRRVLGNLVDNALRYTEKGGVLIGCRRHQGKLWVEVWDSGIGIAEDQTEYVYEEFRQLGDDARNRGSGLGLAIVAKTAKLLGLQIRLRSRPGRGSMFAIELPPGRVVAPALSWDQRFADRSLRIGVVEDNAKVLGALVLALEDAGHEVVAATTGAELMAGLSERRPDIVISDYRLADHETGFDVIQNVKNVFGHDLPALIITGDTDPALIRSMADRGIAVYYKPLQIELFRVFIREVAERRAS
ncbi:ATP-binding protein [Propionivibrio sp.]|uniref:ATP-binding protein n=1 Tax=Propionivibrio sp. TaxID=2212460 RepID=UPI003BF412F9